MTDSKLFQPIKVGNLTLNHRIVLAPLTRNKASEKGHVPCVSVVKEYYSQRGSDPGTLLITEGAFIAQKAGVLKYAPGLWTQEQLNAWKEVTDAVHAKGSFIFCQLWALGRAADHSALKEEDPSLELVGPSPIKIHSSQTPRALTTDEIHEYHELYARAASDAVNKAGFDGVEIHGANGYLVDQFLQDVSNQRTDEYGGSIENRARFGLEIIDAVVKAVEAQRTAVRMSPWSTFMDMGMKDPIPTFSYYVSQIKERHSDLAYIHLVEPRVTGVTTRSLDEIDARESNDFIRDIWAPRPLISAGAYTRESAMETADTKGDIIAFGRYFISNPDITVKLKKNLPLTQYNRSTFYLTGEVATGYIDYPFYSVE